MTDGFCTTPVKKPAHIGGYYLRTRKCIYDYNEDIRVQVVHLSYDIERSTVIVVVEPLSGNAELHQIGVRSWSCTTEYFDSHFKEITDSVELEKCTQITPVEYTSL
jgi:hypothetical protein